MPYDPGRFEPKWQRYWAEHQTFRTDASSERPKYYVLDMFPYPSGHGLHVGHLKGYVASDIVARYKRMRGFEVLHPMGWDSFGLPTERQADREGLHPAAVTKRNVATFRKQLELVGLSYDWSRELATSDASYYKWTQWIFLKLYEKGLAYQAEIPVNWCPALGTVLANEEVKDGRYVETGDPVEKRVMRQWMLKITAYADRLLDDLSLVQWPDSVKELQRNWIGRSEGMIVRFGVGDGDGKAKGDLSFEVFTTRADTLFGCTFCVLAPEHPLVPRIVTADRAEEVAKYVERSKAMSERDRQAQAEVKTGVFTGSYALNPVNGKPAPIWIADYVLVGYGTGAIFGCPAHDERDYGMAKTFGLDIIPVVAGGDVSCEPYLGDGLHINSDFLNGLDRVEATAKIASRLEERKLGQRKTTYHLRDWLFSRQRYWGEPIPILHLPDGSLVTDEDLPILLPEALRPPAKGDELAPPLARSPEEWLSKKASNGVMAKRETNVMPQWAGSCWYYLRFLDPSNEKEAWDPKLEARWLPVDLYLGGIEHATLHLLYARFWHKVLYDCGLVSTKEPFYKLFNQGMVHAPSYKDERGKYYYPKDVFEKDGQWFSKEGNVPLQTRMEKMSKSRYNVASPEDVVEQYGVDTLRMYELFMGPVEDNAIWQSEGLPGVRRFLERAYRLFESAAQPGDGELDEELERAMHRTVRKVTEDIEHLRLNTAVSALMIFLNEATSRPRVPKSVLGVLARIVAPFAPHFAEEVWSMLGNAGGVSRAPWPEWDAAKVIEKEVTVVVQVNGKLRSKVNVPLGSPEDVVRTAAFADPQVDKFIAGKEIKRVIFVQDRLFNIVVS